MDLDKSKICKAYLKKLGKSVKLVKSDGSETEFFAVIGQTWNKNKSKFEDLSSRIGRYYNDYYTYIGPSDYDITVFNENDYIEYNGVRYFFVRQEAVIVGDTVQYYTGIMKKIFEENPDVFNQ
ncbi:MAG: hypothetical protein ACLUFN_02645 [Eubacterium sp.]